mgnify:FL=1
MKRLLLFLFLTGCAGATYVYIDTIKPPEINLPGIERIAVAEFNGPRGSGRQASYKLTEKLIASGKYKVLEREKIRAILEEQGFALSGAVDEATAVEMGKLLGVDALIFGDVTAYNCEDEEGTRMVERWVGTGRYRTVTRRIPFTNKTFTRKEEIKEKKLVEEHYHIRRATVTVNFKVVSVKTGELLAVKSLTRSDKKEIVDGKGTLPSREEMLSRLMDAVVDNFIRLIAPVPVKVTRKLETGTPLLKEGATFAKNGLWDKARDIWEKEKERLPSPEVYYNLGVAYEAMGNLEMAARMYDKAVSMNPKPEYIRALKEVRERLSKGGT